MYFTCFKKCWLDLPIEPNPDLGFTNKMSCKLLLKMLCDKFNQFVNNKKFQEEVYGESLSADEIKVVSEACGLNQFICCVSLY